ncbi:uncharacterized protein LY89DRAFT_251649 [Mollisia scopiformis]|uniref:Uncharacterized protein n=1 Tax=Mollisia scopiformis TaxID=149040 RepID=A0A194WSC1_MOLSC|nr:uncharacterized protein LY89DRAFT_251649 [Mollisia scopiformis]KUJ10865.1 hypothetical protein LY89DRAFT_251649 [Mollisia scopiformis]
MKSIGSPKDNFKSLERDGSRALLFQASLALLTSILLPLLFQLYSAQSYKLYRSLQGEPCSTQKFTFPWLNYRNVWVTSQLLYSFSLVGILSAESREQVIILVGLTGFSFAVNQWIPFLLINLETLSPEESDTRIIDAVGIIQGVNNISIAAPQILAMVFYAGLFWFLGETGDVTPIKGIRWSLCGSVFASFIAAAIASRLGAAPESFLVDDGC